MRNEISEDNKSACRDEKLLRENGGPVLVAMMRGEDEGIAALEQLHGKISRNHLAACLAEAIKLAMEKLFVLLLDRDERRECCGVLDEFRGSGNLLLCAAALNRASFVKILLERGYDCNGAVGPLAKDAQSICWLFWERMPYRYCATNENVLIVRSLRQEVDEVPVHHATPLAAALLCGSVEAAEVLLSQQEIWKGESSVVCRAAVLALEGYQCLRENVTWQMLRTKEYREVWREQHERQLEVIRMIFCPERKKLPSASKMLCSVYLQPGCMVDFCRPAVLIQQLRSGLCDERDAEEILRTLKRHQRRCTDGRVEQLLLTMWKYFPQVCRKSWVVDYFLEVMLRWKEGFWWDQLLPVWREAAGPERDLTWVAHDLLGYTSVKELRALLKQLGKGGELVLDSRYVMWCLGSPAVVAELIRHVHIRFFDKGDIGSLSVFLFRVGNEKILKFAGEKGLLAHEEPQDILRELNREREDRTAHRAAVLVYARGEKLTDDGKSDWRDFERWCGVDAMSFQENRGNGKQRLKKLLRKRLPPEKSMRELYELGNGYTLNDLQSAVRHPLIEWNDDGSVPELACLAEHGGLMEAVLEYIPEIMEETIRCDISYKRKTPCLFKKEKHYFHGSALVLASIFGRTEQIRLLLDRGMQVSDYRNGRVSAIRLKEDATDEMILTPLTAAILFGNEEAARVLMEAGETCDYTCLMHYETLEMATAETLKLIERLGNTGWEKLTERQRRRVRGIAACSSSWL